MVLLTPLFIVHMSNYTHYNVLGWRAGCSFRCVKSGDDLLNAFSPCGLVKPTACSFSCFICWVNIGLCCNCAKSTVLSHRKLFLLLIQQFLGPTQTDILIYLCGLKGMEIWERNSWVSEMQPGLMTTWFRPWDQVWMTWGMIETDQAQRLSLLDKIYPLN